jgi:nuclease S1
MTSTACPRAPLRRALQHRVLLACAAVAAFLAAPCHEARSWGSEGHAIVAEIAQRQLTPAATARVREILGGNVSLASMASWPDDVRVLRPKTSNWHFVDMPLGSSEYVPGRDCKSEPKGDCVINAIKRSQDALGSPATSPADRKEALMFLVHFVGDLHQPLHTVKEFVGGNLLKVTFFNEPTKKKREKTNLHVVWDSLLIKAQYFDWGSYVTVLVEKWLPGKDLDELAKGTAVEWALAAHEIARDVAFEEIEQDDDLGEDYLKAAKPFVDQQLALAGIRLARLLNEALK